MQLEATIKQLLNEEHSGRLSGTDIATIFGNMSIYRVNEWFYERMYECRPRWQATPEYDRFTDNINDLIDTYITDVLNLDPEDKLDVCELSYDQAIHPNLHHGMYLLISPKYLPDASSSSKQEKLSISYAD